MSLVGKAVTYWMTETQPQPAVIINDADPEAVLLRIFGYDPSGDSVTPAGVAKATEPTEGYWTEPDAE